MKDCGIACGECPLNGLCGDPVDTDAPDIDPNEPRPDDAPSCCGGACNA